MRVTEKGQVTIPQPVRRKLGIVPGTEVRFDLRDGDAVLRVVEPDQDEREREAGSFVAHLKSYSGAMDFGGISPAAFLSMLRDD